MTFRTQLYIAGRWRDSSSGASFAVEDPSTGEAIASVADATAADALAALAAAAETQAEWANVAPRERSEILRRAFAESQSREWIRPAEAIDPSRVVPHTIAQ